jgi:hypothetical protein
MLRADPRIGFTTVPDPNDAVFSVVELAGVEPPVQFDPVAKSEPAFAQEIAVCASAS